MADITELIEQVENEEVAEDGGLISEEFFKHNMNSVYDYTRKNESINRLKNIRYKNKEYYPLYAVNFSVDQGLPVNNILNNTYEASSYEKQLAERSSVRLWQSNEIYTGFLKNCMDKKKYNVILFTKHAEDSKCDTKDKLKANLSSRFNSFVDAPIDLKVYRDGRNSAKNYADILSGVKYYCGWAKSKTKRATINDPVVYFLTNFYYMAKLNEHNNQHWIEPMFSVMVKKEYLGYVRACLLTNTPIPTEVLELWIDVKLDRTDSSYKIRPSFVKSIKTPFKQAGVNIVVFEDLFEQLYERPKLPTFRNVVDRLSWTDQTCERLMEEVAIKIGVRLRAPKPSKMEFPKEIIEGLKAPRGSEVDNKLKEFEELLQALTT